MSEAELIELEKGERDLTERLSESLEAIRDEIEELNRVAEARAESIQKLVDYVRLVRKAVA